MKRMGKLLLILLLLVSISCRSTKSVEKADVKTNVVEKKDISTTEKETLQATSLQNSQNKLTKQFMTSISPKKGSLSTIIRSYKSAVTKYANANNIMFDWQPRFYDRIVRNDEEFIRIYDYISHNPKRWEKDELFSK